MGIKNPATLFKITGMWKQFTENHPKFPLFLTALQKSGIPEDSIIEIKITEPDGEEIKTNIKVTQSDLELINELKDLS